MPSHYESPQRSQYLKPTIIDRRRESRGSSVESQGSYESRSSAEYNSTRSSMGYLEEPDRKVTKHKYRVPDDDRHHIESHIRSSEGKREVEVINHRKAYYDASDPRSAKATSNDYKITQRSKQNESRRHKT